MGGGVGWDPSLSPGPEVDPRALFLDPPLPSYWACRSGATQDHGGLTGPRTFGKDIFSHHLSILKILKIL